MENTVPHQNSASKGREHGRHCRWEEKDCQRGDGWGRAGKLKLHNVPLWPKMLTSIYKWDEGSLSRGGVHFSMELWASETGDVRTQFTEIQLGRSNLPNKMLSKVAIRPLGRLYICQVWWFSWSMSNKMAWLSSHMVLLMISKCFTWTFLVNLVGIIQK